MKRISPRTLFVTLFFLVGSGLTGNAEEPGQMSPRELQDKANYCKTCHGINGQGFRGAYPMPRLAGQQPEYLENQLRAFTEHQRTNTLMYGVAHVLSPIMLKGLGAHFKDLNPKPLAGATKDLASAGKRIYEEGVPDASVPPCASCHGNDAKGNGAVPRLAGQLDEYTSKKLANWSKERGQDRNNPDTSAVMEPIAHGLTPQQISAIASYLSVLE